MPESPLDMLYKIAAIVALVGLIVGYFQLRVYQAQGKTMRDQLALLRTQVDDLIEGRKGKLFKLKRAVSSLYDACQDVQAPPATTMEEIRNLNPTRLAAIGLSTDVFFFHEIGNVPKLRDALKDLDEAAQDADHDIRRLLARTPDSSLDAELLAVGKQITKTYQLSGECMLLLDTII